MIFADQSLDFQERLSRVMVVPFFDLNRLQLSTISRPNVWTEAPSDGWITLIWDAPSQQAIIVRYWD